MKKVHSGEEPFIFRIVLTISGFRAYFLVNDPLPVPRHKQEISSDAVDEEESETKTLTSTAQKNAGWDLVFVAAVGALVAAYYFKIYKPHKNVDEEIPVMRDWKMQRITKK